MVALIVSILVGLPIFFLILDLFGRVLSGVSLRKPHITVKTKVFLIGALVPLLIDTMLVQYYWSRTGFFSIETFVVWLFLEILAIAGSLIFVRSFSQSLKPLETIFHDAPLHQNMDLTPLESQSTDEIGVLTTAYRDLLRTLQIQNEVLELNNRLLRETDHIISLESVAKSVIAFAERAIEGDICFLLLHDAGQDKLVGVMQSGLEYNADGYFRISMDEDSIATLTLREGQTISISDVQNDSRCGPLMMQQLNIHSIQSLLSAPLRIEGKPIGVLISTSADVRRDYSTREKSILNGLAREAAQAIQTQRLREKNTKMEEERLESEAQLRDAQKKLELHVEQTPLGVIEWNTHFEVVKWNPAAESIFGFTRTEAMGSKAIDLIIPDNFRTHLDEIWQALLTKKGGLRSTNENITRDKKTIVCEWYNTPLVSETGEVVGVASFVADVTESVRAQNELAKHREHLEELVNERTIELEATNEELEAFSYSVSHDLRAPLRAIDGFSLAVLEDYGDRLDAEGQEYLARVRGGAQRMSGLIDSMLQLSRVSRHSIRMEHVDLSAMAFEVLLRLRESEPERGEVEQMIAPGLSLQGDGHLLELLLANLLENSWKYTKKTLHPRIEFASMIKNEECIYFIKDNGAGFDEKYADKIFGAFQRLHTEDEFPGSGVGLATVQRVVNRHRGRIWAEGHVGKGATFYFTLGPPSILKK